MLYVDFDGDFDTFVHSSKEQICVLGVSIYLLYLDFSDHLSMEPYTIRKNEKKVIFVQIHLPLSCSLLFYIPKLSGDFYIPLLSGGKRFGYFLEEIWLFYQTKSKSLFFLLSKIFFPNGFKTPNDFFFIILKRKKTLD